MGGSAEGSLWTVNRVQIVIGPTAKSDIRSARDYYSDKGENTSERFRDELTQVFDLLSRHPEAVAVAFGRTRLKPSLNSTSIANPIFVLLVGKERCIVLHFDQYDICESGDAFRRQAIRRIR